MAKISTKITKAITISLNQKTGAFSSIYNKIKRNQITNQKEIINLRQLLSNEKAKLINTIKTQNPGSIYELSRILKRDFRAVRHDIKLLEQFGIVELLVSQKNGRERLKPVISIDKIIFTINL